MEKFLRFNERNRYEILSVLQDDKVIKKVIKEIGNLGYGTGVNETRKVTMKYFAN